MSSPEPFPSNLRGDSGGSQVLSGSRESSLCSVPARGRPGFAGPHCAQLTRPVRGQAPIGTGRPDGPRACARAASPSWPAVSAHLSLRLGSRCRDHVARFKSRSFAFPFPLGPGSWIRCVPCIRRIRVFPSPFLPLTAASTLHSRESSLQLIQARSGRPPPGRFGPGLTCQPGPVPHRDWTSRWAPGLCPGRRSAVPVWARGGRLSW